MKGGILFLVGALGLTATSASKDGCSCAGTCQIKGDPHVLNVWQENYVETAKAFTIYKHGHFAITASTEGQYFVQTINFGGEKVSRFQCSDSGKLPKSTFEKNGVKLEVKCSKPKDTAKYGNDWHLDSLLEIKTKNDLSSLSATGVCMVHHNKQSSPNGVDNPTFKKTKPWQCDCSAKCSVQGDPHLLSFYGKKELLKNTEFTVYKLQGFEITAKVNSDFYISEITVTKGHKKTKYNLDQCSDKPKDTNDGRKLRGDGNLTAHSKPPFHPKVLDKFTMNVRGGSVVGEIKCAIEKNGSGPHSKKGAPMLNFFLDKKDFGTGAEGKDFAAMETAQHTSGVCTDK